MTCHPEQREGPAFLRVTQRCLRPAIILALTLAAATAIAQQPMGTIAIRDARLTGAMALHADRATLLSNDAITALDHPALITLARGGSALVCSTSQFHLLHSGTGPALLFGLDRGAVELRGATQPQDVILTPDLRVAVEHAGTLDLALRVTPNGDTCIDNAGPGAPVLVLNASFTGGSYRLLPGQHVLFEHGDLRSVVDHEASSCGCPKPALAPTPAQLASMTPAERAAATNPFPSATSAGLTTPAEASAAPSTAPLIISTNPAANAQPIPIAPESDSPTPTQPHGFFHSLGRFFKHLFS